MNRSLPGFFFLVAFLLLGVCPSLQASDRIKGLVLQVYPNPSPTGIFAVELTDEEKLGDVTIVVFNLIGKRVYEERIHFDAAHFQRNIDLSQETKGMYMLEITHRNGKQVRRLAYK